jgi:isoleucyl-tRNA synthetase
LSNCENLYDWQEKHRSGENEFILHDGPPYANGNIHVGHMVNKVLKDVYLRYKLLNGLKVNYVPGWDCHGQPIELNAMKQQQAYKERNETNILKTREIARSYALKCIESQKSSFNKLNLLVDWTKTYRTIDSGYMCDELDLFHALYKKNLIFRDYMPVYWSISSQTALAEFEIEYNESHISNAVYVQFDLTDYPNELRSLLSKP